jgi:hypothetical protein
MALMTFGLDHSALSRALARLPPHPRLLEISGVLGVGHPLVREVGGVWVQSVCSLWITNSASKLIAADPDDASLARRLAPYLELDRDMLVADIQRRRPDAILITKWGAERVWPDAKVSAALADYRFFASDGNPNPDGEIKIYARQDLLAQAQ